MEGLGYMAFKILRDFLRSIQRISESGIKKMYDTQSRLLLYLCVIFTIFISVFTITLRVRYPKQFILKMHVHRRFFTLQF